MTKQVHIHIHRTKARDAGEGEGKGRWITLSPSGTHVKIDKGGEITAGPKGMTGKKPSELSSKPIKHATGQGQSFLPMQPKMGHGTVTKTGSGFTAKNHKGFKEYFKPHEEEKAKAYAASGKESPSELSSGPKQGEVGHSEHQKYGAYFKKGEQVRGPGGKVHEVFSHVGPAVETSGGRFHPTKVSRAAPTSTNQKVAAEMSRTTSSDPVQQARQFEEKAAKLHQQAQAEYQKNGRTDEYVRLKNEAQKATNQGTDLMVKASAPSVGVKSQGSAGPATTKTDWSKSNGDWTTAKKEGAEMFERALSSAKTGGDRTDAALKLKAEAAQQQKNGSYLGAVVLGLVNDYFDRLK